MMAIQRLRRRPATISRRCTRCWLRKEGRIVRLLSFTDYSPCAHGGEPRWFLKVLTHRRYARGRMLPANEAHVLAEQVLPVVLAGSWVEVTIA